MPTDISSAHGTIVKIGDGAGPEVFTALKQVFGGPKGIGFDTQMIEARFHDSNSTHRKPTFLGPVSVTFSLYFDSTDVQHLLLQTNAQGMTKTNFEIIMTDPGAQKYAFGAYIALSLDTDVDAFNAMSVTLNVDGDVTIS